ncbi:lactoylglutathione lyase [Paenibacillus sp. FSL H7-0326]|uniref:VOC family protein n=1 Tax=Paenibacillus sp. FSL H7-0326 TaxID=1921144 RepID=UPI00096F8E33|nr:VOC family protein [Paenibacillus sp. FSL H7-0326]OMC63992.1 lactoylglutathione lyase [Paenibacillus sp. FSL H7-0326]
MTKSMLGTTAVAQIALLVNDIESASQAYADFFGIDNRGWFWSDEFGITLTEFRGKPTEGRAKLAFLDMGSIQLELIEPDDHPSTWRESLDRHGEGFHHIAFFVEGMQEKILLMEREHMPVLQKGEDAAGQYIYAYMDTFSKLKLLIELLEHQKE